MERKLSKPNFFSFFQNLRKKPKRGEARRLKNMKKTARNANLEYFHHDIALPLINANVELVE